MSVDINFYIGVYLVVDQFIEDTETKRVCENGHQSYRDKFCTKCGTEFKKKEFPRTRRLSCHEAAEEFGFDEDSFRNVDRGDKPCIWVGNGGSLVDADEGDQDEEINPDTIIAAVDEFRETYRTELALLEGNGVEYEMLYGAVIFYS
jgi:hypothetical protein